MIRTLSAELRLSGSIFGACCYHTGESDLYDPIYMIKMAARENGEKYNKLIYDFFLVCSYENWVCTNRFYLIEKAGFGLITVRHAAL